MKAPKFSFPVVAALVGFVIFTSGCTAWREGVQQDVVLKSEPAAANVYINGVEVGQAPLIATMRTKNIYVVEFKKDGFRDLEALVSPIQNLPFVRTGLYTDTGRYNKLKPNPLDGELIADLVPTTASVDPYADLSARMRQLDKMLEEGKIGQAEHKVMSQQLIDAYNPDKK